MRICTEVADLPDDGTDVTDQLVEMIADHPDGTSFQFGDKRYRVEGSVKLTNRNGLTFEGGTFYATEPGVPDGQGNSQRRHFWVEGGTDITFRGVRVESTNTVHPPSDNGGKEGYGGYDPHREFEHGFSCHAVNGLLIEDCSTHGTWGDGVYIGNTVPCTDVTVRNTVISWNGRQGLAVSSADGVTIDNVEVTNSRRSAFDLEPSTTVRYARNVTIANCTTKSIGLPVAAGGRGDISDIYVHHLTAQGQLAMFIKASDGTRRQNWRVEDCVGTPFGSPVAAFRFTKVDNVSLRRVVAPIATTQSRKIARFEDCHGPLSVTDGDFRPGGCHIENVGSDEVTDTGNQKVCP